MRFHEQAEQNSGLSAIVIIFAFMAATLSYGNPVFAASTSTVGRSFSTASPLICSNLTVTLGVTVNAPDTFYAIDEVVPTGWVIANAGTGDITQAGHIKWLVLSGAASTSYPYVITVPCAATGSYAFSGTYMFETDTASRTIGGQTTVSAVSPTGITITPVPSQTAFVGTAYSYPIAASGGNGAFTYSLTGTVPAGLSINSATGLISGTPTTAGAYSFSVRVTDRIVIATSPIGMTVNPAPPVITPIPAQTATAGSAYSYQVMATGTGTLTYSLSAGAPAGISINSLTGLISGTPAAAGAYSFNVSVTDGISITLSPVSMTVNPSIPVITPIPAQTAKVGVAYSYQVLAVGGQAALTYSLTGNVPGGLSINSATGLISGTPTTAGTYNFINVSATDGIAVAIEPMTITVALPSPAINAIPQQSTITGQRVTFNVTATNPNSGMLMYSLQGAPAGAAIDAAGMFSWTAGTPGTYNFNVTVDDMVVAPVSEPVTIIVNVDTPPATTDNTPAVWQNAAFNVILTATDNLAVAYTSYNLDNTGWINGTSIPISTDGNHSIQYYSADSGGNVEIVHTIYALLDATAPATSDNAPAGWQNTAFSVALGQSDALSGVSYTTHNIDNTGWINGTAIPISADGNHSIQYYSVDMAGNTEAIHTIYAALDTATPATSDNVPASWQNTAFNVTLSASDALSGVSYTAYNLDNTMWMNGAVVQISSDGNHTLQYYSVDASGNTEATRTIYAALDATPPATAAYPLTWQNAPFNMTLTAADAKSGVAYTSYSIDGGAWQNGTSLLINASGSHAVNFYSVDNAGNTELTKTEYALLDSTAYTDNNLALAENNITTVSDNTTVLDINATSNQSVSISIRELSSANNTASVGMPALGKYVEITAPALNMSSAVIKVRYTDAEVATAGLDESTLRLWYYNETSAAWTKHDAPDGGVDTTSNYVWARTTHFSTWGIFGSAPAATTTTTTTSSGGGGGGSSGGGGGVAASASEGAASYSWDIIEADDATFVEVEKSDVSIYEIEFRLNERTRSPSMRIVATSSATGLPALQNVYQYLEIEHENLNNTGTSFVRFRVDKTWIDGNGINKSSIVLQRHDSAWTALPTRITREDANSVYYEAQTPGFSHFAVTGEKLALPAETPSATTPAAEQPAATPTPSEPATGLTGQVTAAPLPLAEVSAILIVGAALGFYAWGRMKRKR